MKSIEVFRYSFDSDVIIAPLGDIHFDADCDIDRLEADIERIRKNGYKTILIGDLFDVGFFNQIRAMQERKITLNEALNSLKELFFPIRSQILCVLEGNHDRRIAKTTGFDILEEFAYDLGIPYARGQAVIDICLGMRSNTLRDGRYAYSILATHGWSGGRTSGSKANKISEWSSTWEGIDLFIMGHVHQPMSIPNARYVFDSRTGTLKIKEIRALILGAYQKDALYAVQRAYAPSPQVNYLVKLFANDKRMEISEV